MNRWRLVVRSARQFWQTNLAVLLGVAAATAVLTGALIIGDSVRGSLRDLALSRLGSIHEVILAERFFRPELAQQIEAQNPGTTALPLVLMQGTIQTARPVGQDINVAGNIAILGIDPRFWQLGEVPGWTPEEIGPDEIVLNQALADELDVTAGDLVTLRLPGGNDVPADSPLGRKTAETQSLPRLTVKAVIPTEGLGRFGLHPTQQLPLNAYASREALEDALEQPGKVNALFVSRAEDSQSQLDLSELQLTLEDFNFELNRVRQTFAPEDGEEQTIYDYWQLSSSRMIFGATAAQAIVDEFPTGARPIFTYLATAIGKGDLPDTYQESASP